MPDDLKTMLADIRDALLSREVLWGVVLYFAFGVAIGIALSWAT